MFHQADIQLLLGQLFGQRANIPGALGQQHITFLQHIRQRRRQIGCGSNINRVELAAGTDAASQAATVCTGERCFTGAVHFQQ